MLIYIRYNSPRADYIFSTLLSALGIDKYTVTADKTLLKDLEGPKINYSEERITEEELWIKPFDLLFENKAEEQTIHCFGFNETKAFFKTPDGDFPFDIFAASFYLISRYEEYLPHKTDMYGRYAHENSLAFKEGFLKFPAVNIWLRYFKKTVLKKFPFLHFSPRAFQFLPTYDIDIAWSYLHKAWFRNFGGLLRSMGAGEWSLVSERMKVVSGNQKILLTLMNGFTSCMKNTS